VTHRLRIRRDAKLDIYEAADYYETECKGLGRRFAQSAFEAIEEATRFPEKHRVEIPPTRIALLRRFPFGVFFTVRGQQVVILAVQDLRRSEVRVERVVEQRVLADES
jgi:plasmid stabilization system protein ParE